MGDKAMSDALAVIDSLMDKLAEVEAERDALRALADAALDWFQWTAFRPLSNRDPLERLHHAVNAYHEGGQ
jgi:hypothetical protein